MTDRAKILNYCFMLLVLMIGSMVIKANSSGEWSHFVIIVPVSVIAFFVGRCMSKKMSDIANNR